MDAQVVPPRVVQHVRAWLPGRDDVDDDGQRLVVDRDEIARVFGEGGALGKHHRDDLADVPRAVTADRQLEHLLHGDVDARGEARRDRAEERQRLHPPFEIGEREDVCDAPERPRRLRAHSDDACVRVRAAHERRVKHAGPRHVVEIAPVTAEIARIFLPSHRCAEVPGPHGHPPRYAFFTCSFAARACAGPSRTMRPVSIT